jgi:hypothetical protein
MKTENMGWQCPNCLIVYAPSVKRCECSTSTTVSLSGGFVVGTGGVGTITATDDKCKIYLCSGYISESSNGVCSKCGEPQWKHYTVSST